MYLAHSTINLIDIYACMSRKICSFYEPARSVLLAFQNQIIKSKQVMIASNIKLAAMLHHACTCVCVGVFVAVCLRAQRMQLQGK